MDTREENFGVSATTALKDATPYTETDAYKVSLDFKPDIPVIMSGNNDINGDNRETRNEKFKADYLSIIQSYQDVNPEVKVFVGTAQVEGQWKPLVLR